MMKYLIRLRQSQSAALASVCLTLLSLSSIPPGSATAWAHSARVEATTQTMAWNAVAISGTQIFVSAPRWTGFSTPSVAVLTANRTLKPFPDQKWNDWKPGLDAHTRFINVNALHLDPSGALWVIDTGTPQFGGPPVKDGPKLVQLNPQTGEVLHIYPLQIDAAPRGSYIDDIRFHGHYAYLTDAGLGALLVLDTSTGTIRRVLEDAPATKALSNRPIIMDKQIVRNSKGTPLLVNADPLEVSPDGRFLYFGPLEGPWFKIPTDLLDNPNTSFAELNAAVTPWADLPPIGGSTMDQKGNLYFSSLKDDSVYRRDPFGKITRLVSDPRLHWADAPVLTADGQLWFPVPQLDRLAQFQNGKSKIHLPFMLISIDIRP